jgi:hypothetical protein
MPHRCDSRKTGNLGQSYGLAVNHEPASVLSECRHECPHGWHFQPRRLGGMGRPRYAVTKATRLFNSLNEMSMDWHRGQCSSRKQIGAKKV